MKKLTNPKEILVLTTSSIEGFKILKHYNPVTSHIVAGTNIFNEFLGGLTDVFGGRSNQFQKQISSIYAEAINQLKNDAYKVGANAILGLKIDVDEISGKGKSMFMITAIGTPILYENDYITEDKKNNIISADYLKNISKTKKIITELSEGNTEITNNFWELVINNNIKEAFDFILTKYEHLVKNYPKSETEIFKNNFIRYIHNFENDYVIDKIYNFLSTSSNTDVNVALYKIIEELNLIDFIKIEKLLRSEKWIDKKIAILLTRFDKEIYNSNDIQDLEELVKSIEINLKEVVTYTKKKKGMFSTEEIEVWKCKCEHLNDKNDKFCYQCKSDKFGFNSQYYNRQSAIDNLKEKIEILKEQLL